MTNEVGGPTGGAAVAWANAGEQEARRFRILYQLLAALSKAHGLEQVYEAALASLLEATSADRAAILLFDEDGVIRFKAWQGLSLEYRTAVTGHCPWKQGDRDARPIVIPDISLDPSLKPLEATLQWEHIRSVAFLPLSLDSGVFGKLMLYYAEPHECGGAELEIAEAIAAHVSLAAQHKRMELAHAQTEQRLQSILDNSASVIFLKDLQGRYLLINRRFEELFHVTKTGMLGRTDYDVFPKDVADRFQANDRAVLDAGEAMTMEEEAPQEDGLHSYLSMKFPMEGSHGEIIGVCGIATDITQRKELEADSRYLAAIVENSDDAIVSKDLRGIVTSWNRGAERIFGYSAAEMVGKPISTLAAPERRDEMPALLAKIINGQRVEHYETRRRRKDGEIIDVALTVSPVRDASGRIVGASKIARDITGRKREEQEHAALLVREKDARTTAQLLNRLGLRLAAQLDLERLVQEVTDIATALVQAEFGSFFHNSLSEKGESHMLYTLSGVAKEKFVGSALPPDTTVFAPAFRGSGVIRCDDATKDPRFSQEAPYFGLPEGHSPVRSYLAAPVIARSGEVLGGLFFAHSAPGRFTERHEAILTGIAAQAAIAMDNARLFDQAQLAQAELKRSNEELRRANRDLEVFAYSASHDLQEPLRTIALSAQIIERNWGSKLDSEHASFLTHITGAARRMGALIEDLHAYTVAVKQEDSPAPPVDSARVLGEVLESLKGQIEEAGAAVTSGRLPHVAIHEGRLAQVFQNLISNAIKYHGKEVPRVHITADKGDRWTVFSVTDNGIGIEPQYLEQIFGLFKRLHGRDEYPGSGIGLAICQRVVEQYGGRIWVEQSVVHRGSTFCFSLPS